MSVTRFGPTVRRRLGIGFSAVGAVGLIIGLVGQLTWGPDGPSTDDVAGEAADPGDEVGTDDAEAPTPSVAREAEDDDHESVPGPAELEATDNASDNTTENTKESREPGGAEGTDNTETSETEETVEDFIAVLAAAMKSTDVDTLVARLHPEVVARYGVEQCRTYVATQGDPAFELAHISTSAPLVWAYATDGESVDIVDAFTVTVGQTKTNGFDRREIHLARFEGEVRWFSDCGVPVS